MDAVVAVALVVPAEGPYAEVANARLAAESADFECAPSGWAGTDHSAALPAHDWPLAVDPVVPGPGDRVLAGYSTRAGSSALSAHGLARADCWQQADPIDRHYSPDACSAH